MSVQRLTGLLSVIGLVLLSGVGLPATVPAQPARAALKLKLMGINRTLDPWKLYEEWAQSVEKGRVPQPCG
jgi:hypothetical protein